MVARFAMVRVDDGCDLCDGATFATDAMIAKLAIVAKGRGCESAMVAKLAMFATLRWVRWGD